jgi:hypothetical protein
MKPPFMSCPRYQSCSANDCPLDPEAAMHGGRHAALPGEEVCRASRRVRERVAAAHGLPVGFALLPRERARDGRRAAWLALPAAVREQRAAGLWRGSGPRKSGFGEVTALGGPLGSPSDAPSRIPVCKESA